MMIAQLVLLICILRNVGVLAFDVNHDRVKGAVEKEK